MGMKGFGLAVIAAILLTVFLTDCVFIVRSRKVDFKKV